MIHTYQGNNEGNIYTLFTDGKPEQPASGERWTWGSDSRNRKDGLPLLNTSVRILSREIPTPALYEFVVDFAWEVVKELPDAWTLTSTDIHTWMANRRGGKGSDRKIT